MLNPFSESSSSTAVRQRVVTIHYDADASFALPETTGGSRVEFRRNKGILTRHGRDVWLQDDSSTTVTPVGGTPSRNNDWSTFCARSDDIVRTCAHFARSPPYICNRCRVGRAG